MRITTDNMAICNNISVSYVLKYLFGSKAIELFPHAVFGFTCLWMEKLFPGKKKEYTVYHPF